MLRKTKQIGLVEAIVRQLQNAIVNGEYLPGDKLPPSRDMEKSLGASRGTLREALRILEQKGLIEIKVGVKGGVFVREANLEPMSDNLSLLIQRREISIEELADFRQVVEAGLINRVVDRATDTELEELQGFIPRLEKCALKGGAEGWKELLCIEVEVRKNLIRLARSRIYESVLMPIHFNIFNYTDHYLPGEAGLAEEAFEDWRMVLKALKARDRDTAVIRTKEHIAKFAVRLETGRRDREGE